MSGRLTAPAHWCSTTATFPGCFNSPKLASPHASSGTRRKARFRTRQSSSRRGGPRRAGGSGSRGRTLFVADDGRAQQVRIYSQLETSPCSRIFSARPEGSSPIRQGGSATSGSIILRRSAVTPTETSTLPATARPVAAARCWRTTQPEGKLLWRLFGMEFVDMADVDSHSDQDVYTKEEHFHVDHSGVLATTGNIKATRSIASSIPTIPGCISGRPASGCAALGIAAFCSSWT